LTEKEYSDGLIKRYNLASNPDALNDNEYELALSQALRFQAEDRAAMIPKW